MVRLVGLLNSQKESSELMISQYYLVPGAVATKVFFAGKSDALIERIAKEIPFERLGQVTDVVLVVAFLDSDEGGWINA
ncbi:hypothetical protein SUGI_0196050 [Cryptomeria japonica]|nr:hypothetical protein SUGI_0196050 [Cryptomeria japonica]